MFDLLMLIAHRQSYVTVVLNKCHYSSEIAVFDMSTIIQLASILYISSEHVAR